ncbi:MAG: UDP-N-acetyl-D-glucosamine dehydrogenase [Frankiales bacterium]|jgi:UDP-N-acetyl-D-glucosamine dehydrogenase|nr:UDP-N-acetyl-D-glucosamine dehydrogenase [Frankiales bacterium]
MPDAFAERLGRGDVVVAVVGLGYVGLPLAIGYAERGLQVLGFDTDVERAASLNAGRSHIEDVASERVAGVISQGRFQAVTEARRLQAADAFFICVPTPFDAAKTPDLSYVRRAAETVAAALRPGDLVVLQSTTYPGTTTEVVQPVLEGFGLVAGRDFSLAFSPERVDPGNPVWNVANTPKVVGGLTPRCSERARLLLETVMAQPGLVHVVSSPAAAEMSKLLENTYRAVNIAMVNELAVLSHEMGLDVWEIIDSAATKPFGFQPFRPGIGPGGHCIPVDPYYLAWKAREFDFQTKFIELAADTNLRMAHYVRDRFADFCDAHGTHVRGARVLALGASFKPGVGDVRNSRALRLMELLEERGALVQFVDPYVTEAPVAGRLRKGLELSGLDLTAYDAVIVLVAHPDWPVDAVLGAGVPVFDAVGAFRGRRQPGLEVL